MDERRPELEAEELPVNWPEGMPLPTLEEAEAAVRRIDQMIEDSVKQRQGKLLRYDPEMFTTVVGSQSPQEVDEGPELFNELQARYRSDRFRGMPWPGYVSGENIDEINRTSR